MTFQLPKRKHFVHKAIEPRNLSAKAAAIVEARTNDVWEVKYDGDNVILIKAAGKAYAYSRQGGEVAGAMDKHLRAMESLALDNYVLFGEAWHPEMLHSVIDGDFRRGHDRDEPRRLKVMVFDTVSLAEFMAGKSTSSFASRRTDLEHKIYALRNFGFGNLFEPTFLSISKDVCQEHVTSRREDGELFEIDGFMRKAAHGHWIAGSGSGGEVLKDKDLYTVDLKVEGLVEGEGKFAGMLGAYECTYKGQPQRVGGGRLTDKQRKAIWADKTTVDGGIGSIIEVHALGESTNGLLREPRFAMVRYDKKDGE